MEDYTFLRHVLSFCPICGETHYVEERKRNTNLIIRGVNVKYEETYLHTGCVHPYDDSDFESGELQNKNLSNARDAYRRKMNLLTSDQLFAIRNSYGLSYAEMGVLLDIKEKDLESYENNAIQSLAHDHIIKGLRDNPRNLVELLEYSCDKISKERKKEILERVPKEYL